MQNKKVLDEVKKLDILIVRSSIHNIKEVMDKPASIRQKLILEYLEEHENEDVYQRDLENLLEIRRSTLSGILDTMEKNKLIKRVDSKVDARLKKIVFTEEAKIKRLEIEQFFNNLEQEMISGISEEDLHTFFKVIDKIKSNLNKEEKC